MSPSAHGRPPQSGAGRPLRGIPRSRAYWELKAEQMMNRIFDPDDPIDLPYQTADPERADPPAGPPPSDSTPERDSASPDPRTASVGTTGAQSASQPRSPRTGRSPRPPRQAAHGRASGRRLDDRLVLGSALAGVCMVSVAGSLVYFGYWNRLQQNLTQERNLLLVERLRSLGPANPAPVPGPQPTTPTLPAPTSGQADGSDGLPPPPPEEPWMQQLSTLPQAGAGSPRVLTVPVSPALGSAAPAAAGSTPPGRAPAVSVPQLVGVVGGPGRRSTAIFLVGGSSMSVASGEMIGSSGWRLRSADGETALIERDGDVRQVSIASGNGF